MRPVRLVMQGFGAYRDRTEISFEGVDLFALSGPTGAGKSTVVDAMCMALYGSIPRYDDKRLVAPSISQGLSEATVLLDFLVDGVLYTAVRVVRRTKVGATTREARLESRGEVLAGNAAELTERVTQLLGLSFDHFTRCVVLPQGQFAKFLHDRREERQELLKQLLDIGIYERVASTARTRAATAKAAVTRTEQQLGDLADVTPERRAELAAAADALGALHELARAEEAALAADDARVATARGEADEARRAAALAEAVTIPADVPELARRAAQLDDQLVAAEAALAVARREVDDAERALQALGPAEPLREAQHVHKRLSALVGATAERRDGLSDRLVQLQECQRRVRAESAELDQLLARADAARSQAAAARSTAVQLAELAVPEGAADVASGVREATMSLAAAQQAVESAAAAIAAEESRLHALGDHTELRLAQRRHADRDAAIARLAGMEADLVAARAALGACRDAEADARRHLEATVAELEMAGRAHQAHALRVHLRKGEPCPVCEQSVKTLPAEPLPLEFADAREREAHARDALQRAAAEVATTEAELRRVEAESGSVQRQVASLDVDLVGFGSAVDVDERLVAIAAATTALGSARSCHETASASVDRVRSELDAVHNSQRTLRERLVTVRAALTALDVPPLGDDPVADWGSLVAWAHGQVPQLQEAAQQHAQDATDADDAVSARRAAQVSSCAALGVEMADDQPPVEALVGAVAGATQALESLDRELHERAGLEQRLAELGAAHPLGSATSASVSGRLDEIAAATDALATARRCLTSATDRAEALRRARRDVSVEEQASRTRLLDLYATVSPFGAPVPGGADVHADWQALAVWAQVEAPRRHEQAAACADLASRLDTESRERRDTLRHRCAALGVQVEPAQSVTEAALLAAHRATAARERLDEQLVTAANLQQGLRSHREQEAVAAQLAHLLRADQFEKWLLDDVMVRLVDGASEHLRELSGEQYSLVFEGGDFLVVDHRNADQTRSARTLSGGETFLASLSLALSLAHQLATFATGTSATLDALFLDEGFGTLDADTLDVVASAIEELGSRGRMVGLISHVPELAARVPVRYEVRKIANAATIEQVWQ